MIGMKKGLFGKGTPQYQLEGMTLPAMEQPMPNEISYTPSQMPQTAQRPTSFWQGGDKFTLRDGIAGALAAVGDGLSGWAGGGTGAVGNLMGGREKAAQQAEALRQQALRLAAGQRLGIGADQMMLLGDNVGSVVAGQMKGPEADSFDRAMERAGIAKGSPQYTQYAQQYAQRSAMGPDPILQNARLPSGGEYTGPLTGYEQMIRGGQPQATPTPQIMPRNARPAGKSDDQLFSEARQAVESGADVNTVFRQLREWGVEVN